MTATAPSPFKAGGRVHLRSRNDKDFTARYPAITSALSALPDDTAIDGEVVAMDENGKPSFNLLQNFGSSKAALLYYVFDVLILAGRDVMSEPQMAAWIFFIIAFSFNRRSIMDRDQVDEKNR